MGEYKLPYQTNEEVHHTLREDLRNRRGLRAVKGINGRDSRRKPLQGRKGLQGMRGK